MGVIYNDQEVDFEGVIGEDVVVEIRDYLQKCSPEEVKINLIDCGDLHTAVLQLLCAYHLTYGCQYIYGDAVPAYRQALEGCKLSE